MSMPPRSPVDGERIIPLRLCVTVGSSTEVMRPFVRCPRRDASIDAHDCAGCMRMRSLEWSPDAGGEVRCQVGGSAATDPRADFGELAARTPVHSIGARVATCVTAETSLERVRSLFESGRQTIPVVDEHGRLEAVISRISLEKAPLEGTAADVMARTTLVLPEDAAVASAVALFAFEHASEIPIVKADGTVTGVCLASDVLRWVAARLGYVDPHTNEPPP